MKSIKVTPNFFALYFAGKGLRPIPKNLFIESHIIDLKCKFRIIFYKLKLWLF